jgi:hypothetical protein
MNRAIKEARKRGEIGSEIMLGGEEDEAQEVGIWVHPKCRSKFST